MKRKTKKAMIEELCADGVFEPKHFRGMLKADVAEVYAQHCDSAPPRDIKSPSRVGVVGAPAQVKPDADPDEAGPSCHDCGAEGSDADPITVAPNDEMGERRGDVGRCPACWKKLAETDALVARVEASAADLRTMGRAEFAPGMRRRRTARLYVKGRTWPMRADLKRLGGVWDSFTGAWYVGSLDAIRAIKALHPEAKIVIHREVREALTRAPEEEPTVAALRDAVAEARAALAKAQAALDAAIKAKAPARDEPSGWAAIKAEVDAACAA